MTGRLWRSWWLVLVGLLVAWLCVGSSQAEVERPNTPRGTALRSNPKQPVVGAVRNGLAVPDVKPPLRLKEGAKNPGRKPTHQLADPMAFELPSKVLRPEAEGKGAGRPTPPASNKARPVGGAATLSVDVESDEKDRQQSEASGWAEEWSVALGSTQGMVSQQIVARGPLVVVAGPLPEKRGAESRHGLLIVDGRAGKVVRTLDLPVVPVQPEKWPVGAFPQRAVSSLLLVGDDLILSTVLAEPADKRVPAASGVQVIRMRLDGLVKWGAVLGPLRSAVLTTHLRPSSDGQGQVDVLVGSRAMTSKDPQDEEDVVCLDGVSGAMLPRGARRDTLLTQYRLSSAGRGRLAAESGNVSLPFRLGIEQLRDLPDEVAEGLDPFRTPSVWFADAARTTVWGPLGGLNGALLPVQAKSDGYFVTREPAPSNEGGWVGEAEPEEPGLLFTAARSWASAAVSVGTSGDGTAESLRARTHNWSAPTIADVDVDGIWEVLIVADGQLRAFDSGLSSDVALPYFLGDASGTGLVPARRTSIASYKSKSTRRDVEWFLSALSMAGVDQEDFGARGPVSQLTTEETTELQGLDGREVHSFSRFGDKIFLADTLGSAWLCLAAESCKPSAVQGSVMQVALQSEEGEVVAAWALTRGGELFVVEEPFSDEEDDWDKQEPPGGRILDVADVQGLQATEDGVALLRSQSFTLIPFVGDGEQFGPVANVPFSVSQVMSLDGYWFANNEGHLIAPRVWGDTSEWFLVEKAPFPIRELSAEDGELIMVTADSLSYGLFPGQRVLTPRPVWHWLVGVSFVLVVVGLLLMLAYLRKRKETAGDDVVRNKFQVDAPISSLQQAAAPQRAMADGLMDFIDNPGTRPPLSIAICGPWGSGKSSVMNLVSQDLSSTGRHVVVWFNAWRFDREEDINRAFYQTILQEFRRQAGWAGRVGVAIKRVARMPTGTIIKGLLVGALLGALPFAEHQLMLPLTDSIDSKESSQAVQGMGDFAALLPVLGWLWLRILRPVSQVINLDPSKALKDVAGRVSFVQDLKSEFDLAFSGRRADAKLVVFVDDLDRCRPDLIVDMLEALNQLADTGHVVLVLGIDPSAVETAIAVRFRTMIEQMEREGRHADAGSFGARYLEKMVTVSVDVPELDAGKVLGEVVVDQKSKQTGLQWLQGVVSQRILPAARVVLALGAIGAAAWASTLFLDGNSAQALMAGKQNPAAVEKQADSQEECSESFSTQHAAQHLALAASFASHPNSGKTASAVAGKEASSGDAAGSSPTPFESSATAIGRTESAPLLSQAPPVLASPLERKEASLGGEERVREARSAEAWWMYIALGVALMALTLGGSEWLRLRGRADARPETRDTDGFRRRLRVAAANCCTNPRDAIRFANLTRFIYYLVRRSPGAESREISDARFFSLVERYWSGQPLPRGGKEDWLQKALELWLPRRQDMSPDAAKPRAAADS